MADNRWPMSAKQKRRDAGFSLAEMLVVLVIASILASIVIAGVKNLFSYRAQAASRRLVSDIGYAKKMAETTQVKSGVVFYPAQEKYIVYQSTFTMALADPLTNKPLIRDFTLGDFRKVDIVSAEFPVGSGVEYLEFDPLGRNFTGGNVVFAYGSDSYMVWVENNTGRAYWTKL